MTLRRGHGRPGRAQRVLVPNLGRGLALLAIGSAVALLLLVARSRWYGSDLELGVNLVLAWAPLVVALAIGAVHARRPRSFLLFPLAAVWLLALPNGPYIVTDYLYVGGSAGAPAAYEATMTTLFAVTGVLLALVSLLLVHAVAIDLVGAARAALLPAPVLLICAGGIYIGRVGRLNSWDVVASPFDFADVLGEAVHYPSLRALVLVACMTILLLAAYVALFRVAQLPDAGSIATAETSRSSVSRA